MTKSLSREPQFRLNAVCPYYTMFPLDFPITILKRKPKTTIVFDPFCGRGTTNYAAQTLGIRSYGLDTSPIAVAIAKAKLVAVSLEEVLRLADKMLETLGDPKMPESVFWEWAFHHETLYQLCKLREGLLNEDDDEAPIMLRAIALGCLHGPLTKDPNRPSYFSNQMPRTFASKPNYSVKYWQNRKMKPRYVDIRYPLRKKAEIVLKFPTQLASNPDSIECRDSRDYGSYRHFPQIDLVISSPPYYGMRTYVQDQWLRHWFLGGPARVDYDAVSQVNHFSPNDFSKSLAEVWDNIYNLASNNIRMVIRFGGLASRKANYAAIIRESLRQSAGNWRIYFSRNAGTASKGKRQAEAMGIGVESSAIEEKDYFIKLDTQ